ncbi:hypothetical protein H4W33_004261 [Kibdelosporangium phytohabitans]|nr:hypothetical protein [Kibdelosporangium phytohabitans]
MTQYQHDWVPPGVVVAVNLDVNTLVSAGTGRKDD